MDESMADEGIGAVTEALTGLVGDLEGFKQVIEDRMDRQDARLAKAATFARTPLAGAEPVEAPHLKAMGAYLRHGDDDGLRALPLEGKALNTAVAAEGGYLVDPKTSEAVSSVLRDQASLRGVSSVVTVEASSFDVLIDHAELGAGWASETTAPGETETSAFDRVSIPLHELAAMPKASQRLLDDAAFDVEGWLAARIAERFARAEQHPDWPRRRELARRAGRGLPVAGDGLAVFRAGVRGVGG